MWYLGTLRALFCTSIAKIVESVMCDFIKKDERRRGKGTPLLSHSNQKAKSKKSFCEKLFHWHLIPISYHIRKVRRHSRVHAI